MGGKQQFINEQTLMGSFTDEFRVCRKKSSLLAPVPGSQCIFCRVRHEPCLTSLHWRHYPKLTGKWWPQHPPYHFPLECKLHRKTPTRTHEPNEHFLSSLLNKSSVIQMMVDWYCEKLGCFQPNSICVIQQTFDNYRLSPKSSRVNRVFKCFVSDGVLVLHQFFNNSLCGIKSSNIISHLLLTVTTGARSFNLNKLNKMTYVHNTVLLILSVFIF